MGLRLNGIVLSFGDISPVKGMSKRILDGEPSAQISREFLIRLKLNRTPAYRVANRAGVNPNTLSRLINGIDRVKRRDTRIVAVGQLLGLDETECFEQSGRGTKT